MCHPGRDDAIEAIGITNKRKLCIVERDISRAKKSYETHTGCHTEPGRDT